MEVSKYSNCWFMWALSSLDRKNWSYTAVILQHFSYVGSVTALVELFLLCVCVCVCVCLAIRYADPWLDQPSEYTQAGRITGIEKIPWALASISLLNAEFNVSTYNLIVILIPKLGLHLLLSFLFEADLNTKQDFVPLVEIFNFKC
jgi:hypothetical protein